MNGNRRAALGVALLSMTASCGLAAGAGGAAAAPITEFSSGLGTDPNGLTVGPDGNLWFLDSGAIGRITPSGAITEFSSGLLAGSVPHALVTGDDGDLWFTDSGTTHAIGRITPSGTITEPVGSLPAGAVPYELTVAGDGTIWFTDPGNKAIGRIEPSTGTITEFSVTGLDPVPSLDEITTGPDGNVYVTDKGNDPGIIEVQLDGTLTESYTTVPGSTMPSGIGPGTDGNVWFADQGRIGRTLPASGTTAGASTVFTNGLQVNAEPDAIIAGPDGNDWFDDQLASSDAVGRVSPTGAIIEYPLGSTPWDLAAGIDGDLWVPITDMGTPGSAAVVRTTPSGTETAITAGLSSAAEFTDANTNIVSGPDGNLWTIDGGSPKAIVRVDVQLPPTVSTGAANGVSQSAATIAGTANARGSATTVTIEYGTTPALSSTAAAGGDVSGDADTAVSGTLSGLTAGTTYDYRLSATNSYGTVTGATQSFATAPAASSGSGGGGSASGGGSTGGGGSGGGGSTGARTLKAHLGNQAITVSLASGSASGCVAAAAGLPVTVASTTVAGGRAARLRVRSASVFLDRGIKSVRTVHRGKRVRRVTVYRPNATRSHLPATLTVSLHGITAGTHQLKVTLTYARTVKRHGHTHTVTVTKSLRTAIRVC